MVRMMSVENIGERRFQRDIERIAAVGSGYVALIIETIGVELDCLDKVRQLVREHAEIIPAPGGDPQRPAPPGAA